MTKSEAFLPEGYVLKTSTSGGYLKLQDGDSVKVRILTNSIVGYEYFRVNGESVSPVRGRVPFNGTPSDSKDWQAPKEFWAFVVWNYESQSCQIWEVTQASIKKAIFTLYNDPDFGDPKTYDLKIARTWKGLDTTYTIMPLNKWEFENTDAIKEAMSVRLEALFDGDDPFKPF